MSTYRYTITDARKAFTRLCELLNKRPATNYNDVGGWRLDNYTMYGGVNVEEVYNEQGGITHPLGAIRYTPREFCMMVDFVARSIEVKARD